ncbi:MAG TPA: DUF4382 domain-containing protein [Lentimicrobium sp.]|nr:DUF4382 domain-containing protein [Lentimicrobium sp.]
MKKINNVVLTTLALLTTLIIASCDKNNDNDNNNGSDKATVKVMLTDAPAQYDAVLVDIQEVQLHSEVDGWITVPLENPGVYNLLEFNNGMDVLLGTCEIPEGVISQVRLVLGSENSVIVDSTEYPLTVPSGSTSGIKLNIHEAVEAGYSYTFWLDFDAAQSIHQTGNGKYMLKPVIRMYTAPSTGSIEGYVLPEEALPLVTLYDEDDTLMALPDSLGYFKIMGIAEGTYSIDFSSQLDTLPYATQTLNDVQVVAGETNQLDTITLILP